MTLKLPSVLIQSIALIALLPLAGCGSQQKKDRGFFTSGSKEADQRADQRMAKTEQLKGGAEGTGDKKTDEDRKTLFERLGGAEGINAVIEDFVPRLIVDPRVNFPRKGMKRGGFTLHRGDSLEWNASPENIATLKKHLAQFIALATGGPAQYDGKEMKASHAGLHISNAEFDASVGDLKATLDKLKIANKEQKELLSIVESTRTQVAEER